MNGVMLLFIAAVLSGCASASPGLISIQEIYDHPSVYDGKRVRVQGVLTYETENIGIYQNLEQSCGLNPPPIVLSTTRVEARRIINMGTRSLVTIVGTFSNDNSKEMYDRKLHPAPDGEYVMTIGVVGPGPLRQIRLVENSGTVLCSPENE